MPRRTRKAEARQFVVANQTNDLRVSAKELNRQRKAQIRADKGTE